MNRRKFIATSCISCGLLLTLAASCGTTSKYIIGSISGSDMLIPISEFEVKQSGKQTFRNYIIAQNDILKYPICIYRFTDNHYEALWMRCSHQGAELQLFGDKMQCPAHGSEFDNHGQVINGPAAKPLRTFPVTVSDNQISISLR